MRGVKNGRNLRKSVPTLLVAQRPDELRINGDLRQIQGVKFGLDPAFQEVLTPVKSGDRRGRIKVRGICARDFGTLFLDLEMAEQGGRTQRSGEYCRSVSL